MFSLNIAPRIGKIFLFTLSLIPLVLLVWKGFTDQLGANPIEKITHYTGDWSLRFLLLTLSVTSVRRLFGWKTLLRYRRMLGLFCFFYVCLHFLTYLVLDQFFDWQDIVKDIIKRPYITIGFAAFLMLIPLAVTSTNKMMRRLGKRWQQLHQLVYMVAVFGILHYLWLVKADVREPVIYGVILLVLLGQRVVTQRLNSKQLAARKV